MARRRKRGGYRMPVLLGVAGGIALLVYRDEIPALANAQLGSVQLGGAAGAPAGPVAGFDADQMGHARTIVSVGRGMGVAEQGQVVAIAAAIQESTLRNLDYGDRDSLGLFQQRPTMGWGTEEQVTDPVYAATRFYEGLLAVPGWQQMSVTDAAQAVQQSGFPGAYAEHEAAARAIVTAL